MSEFKLFAVDVSVNFINFISKRIADLSKNSKVKVVFPNIRPLRFVEKKLDLKRVLNCSFYSMPDFVKDIVLTYSEDVPVFQEEIDRLISVLNILKKSSSLYKTLGGDDSSVFPWVRKLSSLFSEIDRQLIESVKDFEYFDDTVPEAKALLENLEFLYSEYRKDVERKNAVFGGELYRRAFNLVKNKDFLNDNEESVFVFCGFSYLSESEKGIMDFIKDNFKTEIYFQTDLFDRHGILNKRHFDVYGIYRDWVSGKFWGKKPEEVSFKKTKPEISFFQAYDVHSEVRKVSEILGKIIGSLGKNETESPEKIGIILPDNSSLFPLLFYFPEKAKGVKKNITLGFPFEKTGLGDFLSKLFKLLVDLERSGGKRIFTPLFLNFLKSETMNLLDLKTDKTAFDYAYHYLTENNINFITIPDYSLVEDGAVKSLVKAIVEKIILPFFRADNFSSLAEAFENFYSMIDGERVNSEEFLYERAVLKNFYSKVVSRLKALPEKDIVGIKCNPRLFYSVISVLSKNISIPFEGNPLKGVQIMGMLEARSLSFDYLFVLDVNEGVLPSTEKVDPLMPEVLKTELGLSGFKERENLFKYNFFRLVDSSKRVFLFFQSGQTSDEKKIRSRFIEQLILEKQFEGDIKEADFDEHFVEKIGITLKGFSSGGALKGKIKEDWIREKIDAFFDGKYGISATFVNDYLTCPYMFYLKRIAGIGERGELKEGQRADKVGLLVHKLLEKGFKLYKDSYLDGKKLENIKKAIKLEFGHFVSKGSFRDFQIEGKEEQKEIIELANYFKTLDEVRKSVLKEVAFFRLDSLFKFFHSEISRGRVQLCDFEVELKEVEELEIAGENRAVCFKGFADRIDRVETEGEKFYKIIDYKTGSFAKTPPSRFNIEELEEIEFDEKGVEKLKKAINSVQLPLYVYLYHKNKNIPPETIVSSLYLIGESNPKNIEKSFKWAKFFGDKDDFILFLNKVFTHMVESEAMFALPGDSCKFCNYKHFCVFAE